MQDRCPLFASEPQAGALGSASGRSTHHLPQLQLRGWAPRKERPGQGLPGAGGKLSPSSDRGGGGDNKGGPAGVPLTLTPRG